MGRRRALRCGRVFVAAVLLALAGSAAAAASCTDDLTSNTCSPGSGGVALNCAAEWLLTPQPVADHKGIPKSRVTCREGDPSCDFDSEADVCTFRVSMCINNTDPRFPECHPSRVDYFEVKSPLANRGDSFDAGNRASLEHLATCAEGGVCVPLVSNGAIVLNEDSTLIGNPTRDLCSGVAEIRVPLHKRIGKSAVKTRRSISLLTKADGRPDVDTLRFECLPGTCGNGIIEAPREQCDDHNRVAGDGCDPSCQIEIPTATPSITLTPLPTLTATMSPTAVPTYTATSSPSQTATSTPSPTPTSTRSPTNTPSTSPTRTASSSPTSTASFSPTLTWSPSSTPTVSPSATPTRTPTLTRTKSPTISPTATLTVPSATPTSSPTVTPPQPCNPDSETYSERAFYRSLAYRWAPIILQDTASKWNADFIGKINYDNDWRSNNNWDNLPSAGIAPYIYYDVLETSTHWFIHYHTYHPRDWDNAFFGTCGPDPDCHENDTENLFMMIQKDGSTYGRFRLMETEAHTSFYQYALASDGVSNGSGPDADDIDNDSNRGFTLFTDTSVGVNDPRPSIYIESKGHAICDWWDNDGPYCTHPDDMVGSSGNDGVMYYPSDTIPSSVPPDPSGGQWYNFKSPYNLISLWDDVWVLRSCLGDGMTFDLPFTYPGVSGNGSPYIGGAMDGDDYADDAGTAWWAQSHGNLAPGDWTMDPATTVLRQLTFSEPVSTTYLYNPFFGIQ